MTGSAVQEREFARRLGRSLVPAETFAERVGRALDEGRGFAAGKLGNTERSLLQYPMVLERETDRMRIWAFERMLKAKVLLTAGLFPADSAFYRRFVARYAENVRALDSVGVDPRALRASLELLRYHDVEGEVVRWWDQEPDHSVPYDERRCWLPHLRGRRVLLASPFAQLLAERANRETFEAVWAATGAPWFEPARVEALEFPYGYSRRTWDDFPTALHLLDDIAARLDERDFDLAIIGAGGLGIPIASHVKSTGRVGISLGGHIQPLFGVGGERWRGFADWQEAGIFNHAWIDLPDEYRPEPSETIEDYW